MLQNGVDCGIKEIIISQKNRGRYVRINRHITSPQVRVKDRGIDRGIMPTQQAIDIAIAEGLDLVEIVPHANPPVCEIIDFGKWRFDEKKKEKEQRNSQKIIRPKEIRLRPVSEDHDVDHKIEQLKKFLMDKHVVQVNMKFKGRECRRGYELSSLVDRGRNVIDRIIKAVEEIGKTERPPRFEGTTLSVRFAPK